MKHLSVLFLLSLLSVQALCYEATVDGVTYIYEEYHVNQVDGTNDVVKMCSITDIKGSVPDSLIIPQSLDEFIVVSIGWNFLKDCHSLIHVELPLFCREVNTAFINCLNLESVVMDSHIDYVNPYAFEGCNKVRSLTCYALLPPTYWHSSDPSIHFSDDVRNNATLYVRPGCKQAYSESLVWGNFLNIEEMDVPQYRVGDENKSYIDGIPYIYTILSVEEKTCMFGRKVPSSKLVNENRYDDGPHWLATKYGKTEIVNIPSEIDGFTVTELGYKCLYGIDLDSIVIPETVKKICGYMSNHQIYELVIPASVRYIGPSFAYSYHYRVDPSNPVYDSRYDCDAIIHTASNTLLFGGTSIRTIPDDVVGIGDYAFRGCYLNESFVIPASVKKIGVGAFAGSHIDKKCSLAHFQIPTFMTEVPPYLFSGCVGLISVKFHDSVKTIGESAFSGCKITDVNLPVSLVYIGHRAFYGCHSLRSVNIDLDSLVYIGDGAFYETALINVELPNHAIEMGERAFGGARPRNRSIMIPESFEGFGAKAFSVYDVYDSPYNPYDAQGILSMAPISVLVSRKTNPTEIDTDVFDDKTVANATLYVPDGTIPLYQSLSGWDQFENIKEISELTMDMKSSKNISPISVYSPNGIKLKSSGNGVNIIRLDNGETKKVVVTKE